MANKTVDRKKAVPARSQAAKASPKNVNAKAAQPSAATQARPSDRKPEKSAVLQVEEVDSEETLVEEEEETTEEEVEVVEDDEEEEEEEVVEEDEEEEEEVVEEKPARRSSARARKERDLVAVGPQDYSVSRPSGSRIPNFPGSQFLRSSYRELRLVTWPSRRDTWNWTVVVVAVCVVIALLLGATDLALSQFVKWWLSLAH